MSGYPDGGYDSPRPLSEQELAAARSAAQVPGVLLLLTGFLSLVGSVWGLVQLPQVPAQMDEAMAQIEADPNVPREQKDGWRNILTQARDAAASPVAWLGYALGIGSSLVVLLGGYKLVTVSGRGLPIAASVLAMIPCTVGCCCVLGVPAGFWALLVLSRADVKAAIAASRQAPPADPDAQYLR